MTQVASARSPTLLLFDIDGTLIASGGAGERALRSAVQDQFAVADGIQGVEIAGRTDSGIAREIMRRFGAEESDANIQRFFDSYLLHLGRLLPETKGRLLPGVGELLEALSLRSGVVLGLLTGNLARGAELKLRHFGIWHFFGFGAYADDHHERNELGRFACRRAQETHGMEIPASRTYVIGDTPYDIACGRAFGAQTVAVATGIHTSEQLAPYNPDFLFRDLSDTPAVQRAFGLPPA